MKSDNFYIVIQSQFNVSIDKNQKFETIIKFHNKHFLLVYSSIFLFIFIKF
jgi:hypothetical protein